MTALRIHKLNGWKSIFNMYKAIPNIDGYVINEWGVVKSSKTGKVLKGSNHTAGYRKVMLATPKGSKNFFIHRLVALAYLPNPKNKSQVNHIDRDKQNNHVSNLEWCTPEENLLHLAHKVYFKRIRGIYSANRKQSLIEFIDKIYQLKYIK